ncbi:S9 family peptidase [Catalinimonas niigatensis]|uniref:S9 family peptidase n=1 Tax=Catalinimonas niigatensis TaxID=1397264 RepID=UPI0026659DA3|nr:S9 family peptidase [Catalinimonas niigatensis]WPP53595.1 S9 family peptidase [Catalinimonas niigatensis]
MKYYLYPYTFLLLGVTIFFGCEPATDQSEAVLVAPPDAPVAQKQDTTLTFHGDSRVDPYFWMRLTDEQKIADKPDAQTQDVLQYLEEENLYTEAALNDTEGLQEELYQEMVGRIKQTDESVPYFENGYWYYSRYEEGQEYPIYCRKKENLEAKEEVLLNVNALAEGYDYFDVEGLEVSPDNKLLAFGEDTQSRRRYTLRFKNLQTGEMLPDQIPNTQGDGTWAKDNKTFFYTSKDQVTLLSNKILAHQLGQDVAQDVLKYEEKDPSFYMGVYKSKSGDYIIIGERSTLANDYHLLRADQPKGDFQQFIPREAQHLYDIDHVDGKFVILTDWEAPNYRLMETPVDATAKNNWKEIIPHREDVFLSDFDVFKNYLVVNERSNALPKLKVIDLQNDEEHYIQLDEPAYTLSSSTNPEYDTEILRYGYSSLTTPASIYDYNMQTREQELKKQQEVVGGHDPSAYVTERLFAPARDGVQVPISLVYKKGTTLNAETPLLLYAYGSYGSSTNPYFNSTRLSLLDRGFVYAIAHIRGGQEMGRQWYEDGKMFKKKNTFNDFVDCADYLISENYTSSEHLYAMGGSAGGLLMGAVANMAPDRFNGIIAAVPFVDVISTMMDESIPLTTNEFDEWGNPKNLESYEYMLSYSPYDNVQEQEYPHMLVTTGYFDSQVQYWEPAKWVAKLRDKKTDDNLLLLETNMSAGHGGSSGRFQQYREKALEYAFLLKLEEASETE